MAGSNVFATAANARGIPGAPVDFFDSNAGTETKLTTTPAAVVTDATGKYTATIPGMRADGTAVNLVVKVRSENSASRIGPVGIGADATLVYKKASTPTPVNAAAMTVALLVDNTNLTLLGAFALLEGIGTARDFVVNNNSGQEWALRLP